MSAPETAGWIRLVVGSVILAVAAGLIWGASASGGLKEWVEFPAFGEHGHEGGGTHLSPAGTRVASGLRCPCGCPDLLLACDCGNPKGASEVKRLIMELLSQGRSESDTRIELVNKYGAAIHRLGR